MINQILSFVLQTVTGIVFGFAMDALLPIKKNAPPKWVRVGFWYLSFAIAGALNIFIFVTPYPVNYLGFVIAIVVALVTFRLFYDGAFNHKLMACILLWLAVS